MDRKSALLYENIEANMGKTAKGEPLEEEWIQGVRVVRWSVPRGRGQRYRCATLWSEPIWCLDRGGFFDLSTCLAGELSEWLGARQRGGDSFSVLTVGLGNRALTPDALGPETVARLATGAWQRVSAPPLRLAAFSPDVSGNTGIETAALIRGAVQAAHADAVLAVDALVAKDPRRLASAIQLYEGGITPASGVGEGQAVICEESVGVPVLSIGIPTVVRAYDLIEQALCEADTVSDEARARILRGQGAGLFVTPKEIDLILKSAAILLSDAIHTACGIQPQA